MHPVFVPLGPEHADEVMRIFNHYCVHSFAAFASRELPVSFYGKFLELSAGYPAYAVTADGAVIGFCFLSSYNPFPSFQKTAKFSCFLAPEVRGCGIGSACLDTVCSAAKEMHISTIVSEIADCNQESIVFHERRGFVRAGELPGVGEKFGRPFGIVLMTKVL